MSPPLIQHKDLVKLAERWLVHDKCCKPVLTEPVGLREQPDAVGFIPLIGYGALHNTSWTVVVEAKCSRADFLADKLKPFRQHPHMGMGQYRYYIAEPGLIEPDVDLPEETVGWGLIEVENGSPRVVKESQTFWKRALWAETELLRLTVLNATWAAKRTANECRPGQAKKTPQSAKDLIHNYLRDNPNTDAKVLMLALWDKLRGPCFTKPNARRAIQEVLQSQLVESSK